jgi:DNA-binding transcriptional LysR family regulator
VDRLRQLEVFTRIAELGSLSRAAESLGMSNAAASRHLAAIEERLSVRLIERNQSRAGRRLQASARLGRQTLSAPA